MLKRENETVQLEKDSQAVCKHWFSGGYQQALRVNTSKMMQYNYSGTLVSKNNYRITKNDSSLKYVIL